MSPFALRSCAQCDPMVRHVDLSFRGQLTYMSIGDEIRRRRAEGRLHLVRGRMPGSSVRRPLFVTTDLWARLNGPWEQTADMERWSNLWADLERFVEGRSIDPEYLYWLTPTRDMVFEIRSVLPAPSLRIFASFAKEDVLIATCYAERPWLGRWGSKQWRDAIVKSKAIWRNLFPTYNPHSGVSIHDFITDNVLDATPFHKGGNRRPRIRIQPSKVEEPAI